MVGGRNGATKETSGQRLQMDLSCARCVQVSSPSMRTHAHMFKPINASSLSPGTPSARPRRRRCQASAAAPALRAPFFVARDFVPGRLDMPQENALRTDKRIETLTTQHVNYMATFPLDPHRLVVRPATSRTNGPWIEISSPRLFMDHFRTLHPTAGDRPQVSGGDGRGHAGAAGHRSGDAPPLRI